MDRKRFVVLVTSGPGEIVSVRWNPDLERIKEFCRTARTPGRGFEWPPDIERLDLRDPEHLVSLSLVGYYLEITVAGDGLVLGAQITSVKYHSSGS